MFKFVILSALVACAVAKPGLLGGAHVELAQPIIKSTLIHEPATIAVQEPFIAKVGEIVRSSPASSAHTSQTIVHGGSHSITPIFEKGLKTVHAPAIRTYETPVVAGYAATPLIKEYAATAPLIKEYAATAPLIKSYGYSAPLVKNFNLGLEASILPTTYSAGFKSGLTHFDGLKTYGAAPVFHSGITSFKTAPLLKSVNTHYDAPLINTW